MSTVERPPNGDHGIPQIALVISSPRSGSTLLGKVLASTGYAVDVGELSRLARHYPKGCWCGQPYDRCPVWDTALAGKTLGKAPATAFPPAPPRTLRWWALLSLIAGRHRVPCNPAVEQYRQHLATIIRRLSTSSPGTVIVDTSKEPTHLIAMATLPAHVHLIRLMRDPRGVVFSRKRKLQSRTGRAPRRYLVRDSLEWSVKTVLGAVMARRVKAITTHVVWYDDLVRDPQGVVSRLAAIPPLNGATVALDEQGHLHIEEDHAISGNVAFRKRNPSSDSRGRSDHWKPVALRLDETWRRDLSRADQALVKALTAPARLLVAGPVTPSPAAAATLLRKKRRAEAGRTRSPRIRRVAISNVYADDNRGGAAITGATVDAVRTAFPGADVTLVSVTTDPERLADVHRHTLRARPEVEVVPAAVPVHAGVMAGTRAVLRSFGYLAIPGWAARTNPSVARIVQADLVVGKGGQLLRSYRWTSLPGLWLSAWPLVCAWRLGRPAVVYAVSVGPFDHSGISGPLSRAMVGWVLRRCRLILLRDDASAQRVQQLGVRTDRVHRIPDSVFAVEPPPAQRTAIVLDRLGLAGKRYAALTTSSHMNSPAEADRINPELGIVVRALLDAGAVEAVLVVLQIDGRATSDRVGATRFVDYMQDTRVALVDDDLGVDDLLALYRGARLTVGGRVHSNIFSLIVGTPPFPFDVHRDKALELFAPIGLDDLVVKMDAGVGTQAADRILAALTNEAALRSRVAAVARRLQGEARRSGELLLTLEGS